MRYAASLGCDVTVKCVCAGQRASTAGNAHKLSTWPHKQDSRVRSLQDTRVSARPLEYRFTVARSALLGRSYYTDGSNAFCTAIYFGIACGSHNSVLVDGRYDTISLAANARHPPRTPHSLGGRQAGDDGLGAIIFVGNPLWTHTLWQTPTACGWRRPS